MMIPANNADQEAFLAALRSRLEGFTVDGQIDPLTGVFALRATRRFVISAGINPDIPADRPMADEILDGTATTILDRYRQSLSDELARVVLASPDRP